MARYCPKCAAEYQDWVEKCLDCNDKMIETKPLPSWSAKEEPEIIERGSRRYFKEPLAQVAAFASTLEAQFSKGVLESEGINSIIGNADTVILSGRNTSTITPIGLFVRESDVKKAKEILDSIITDISKDNIPEIDQPGDNPD